MFTFQAGDTSGNVRPVDPGGTAMPPSTPRNALDRRRTPRRISGFLKSSTVCFLVAGVLSPLSPMSPLAPDAAAAGAASGATTAAVTDSNIATYIPPAKHPQSTDQDYCISWNNLNADW